MYSRKLISDALILLLNLTLFYLCHLMNYQVVWFWICIHTVPSFIYTFQQTYNHKLRQQLLPPFYYMNNQIMNSYEYIWFLLYNSSKLIILFITSFMGSTSCLWGHYPMWKLKGNWKYYRFWLIWKLSWWYKIVIYPCKLIWKSNPNKLLQ